MATQTKTTKSQSKSQSTKAQSASRSTQRRTAPARGERSVSTTVRDGAYATLGLTDSLVGALREAPSKALRARETMPEMLDQYAERGKTVAGRVRASAPSRRALEQARVARSQVKAAATSLRKTVRGGAEAAGHVVDSAGASSTTNDPGNSSDSGSAS